MWDVFESFVKEYEGWFLKHKFAYLSELRAVKTLLPEGKGVEIGVGTGRFAAPLKIKIGVEPSKRMGEIARRRGILVMEGTAENLPLKDESFDFALMVTTICFVDDPLKALQETKRMIKKGGYILVGIVDRESFLGREYEKKKEKSLFYKRARFFSTEEIVHLMKKAGFEDFRMVQTLFKHPSKLTDVEPVREGHGEGAFVVIRGKRG
ncbi:class I SAM-dependent methyltransferase [Thermotoga sp. SG1]|uniref:class I SAM-dependent methyltransferase n=1 Tax=Thermotoga sp. SG1 TaxID=126739 RepID=UPI000C78202B|nr:class I SAM-dependent methyltransferase [Thermotoga sp. SG1]PLV56322.1 methyltransferase type 11 [Thermotoga sp. SG1]